MRVISGSARSLKLKTIEGDQTRPTTDRIKETLFNIIGSEVIDADFLDLFSGSGGIGIEALSRGAHLGVFVDNNPRCISVIKENLKFTRLEEAALVVKSDVISYIKSCKNSFDIIFIDPPYRAGVERTVLEAILDNKLCNDNTLIIIEAMESFDEGLIEECGFYIEKSKVYGSNKHIFIRKQDGEEGI